MALKIWCIVSDNDGFDVLNVLAFAIVALEGNARLVPDDGG
ncbi:hypothetical protein [Geomonas subterranea]|nr:hypothetical protein [Geomonas fuzhouensis]